MNWYKKAQGYIAPSIRINYPYSLIEAIRMQGENGLSMGSMCQEELKDAKILEEEGVIKRIVRRDQAGRYVTYIMNEDYVMGDEELGMDV